MRFEDLAGRDVVIWGAGREGRAAYTELHRRGIRASFALTGDSVAPDDLVSSAVIGSTALERLASAEVVIKSPGVPHTAREFIRLRELGITVTSLTDLWLSSNAARVLAVTGTKGKSTTSSLAQHMLTAIGISASLVGNGGTPVTEDDMIESEVAVTEVSSYQAADLSNSPRVAVITSLYPEHLPWHGGYDQYVADKLNLVAYDPEFVVVPDLSGAIAKLVYERVRSGTTVVDPSSLGISSSQNGIRWVDVGQLGAADVPIQGKHNISNVALALTAVAVGYAVPVDQRSRLLAAVGTFVPLANRLEKVPSGDGRRWVDDGLATVPEAVVAALETFPDERVALIFGGADRGLSFAPLRDYLTARSGEPVQVIAIGPAGRRWVDEGGPNTQLVSGFSEAMTLLHANPTRSDVVLLSPGAPSFDEFDSYEERSAAFRSAASQSTSRDKQ